LEFGLRVRSIARGHEEITDKGDLSVVKTARLKTMSWPEKLGGSLLVSESFVSASPVPLLQRRF
jgi:hypothetical protein